MATAKKDILGNILCGQCGSPFDHDGDCMGCGKTNIQDRIRYPQEPAKFNPSFYKDKMIYLASPYSSPDKELEAHRGRWAEEGMAKLLNAGYACVYSPIASCWHVHTRFKLPGDWNFWQKFDRIVIDRVDALFVLMIYGWEESVGVQAEIAYALEKDKPVFYYDMTNGEIYNDVITSA